MIEIPENWQLMKLGDCCEIILGSTPQRNKKEYWDGDIPWVTPKDLSHLNQPVLEDTPEKITEAGYKSCSTSLLPQGSILFSSRAPIGHIAIVGKPMCTNQGFKSFIPGKNLYSPYLYWCMKKYTPNIKALGTGTTFKEVSKGVIEKFEIPVPPIEEQRRIAAILDQADGVRRKRQEAIRLTEELLRATFLDMFGDPVTNPKGWERYQLQNISEKIIDCPHSTPKWTDHGIICLRTSNLTKGGWNWDDTRYVDIKDYKERTSRSEIDGGDIILSREGTVGVAAIVLENMKICMGQRLVQVRPNQQIVKPNYLLQLLLWQLAPERINRLMRGSRSVESRHKTLHFFRRVSPS